MVLVNHLSASFCSSSLKSFGAGSTRPVPCSMNGPTRYTDNHSNAALLSASPGLNLYHALSFSVTISIIIVFRDGRVISFIFILLFINFIRSG